MRDETDPLRDLGKQLPYDRPDSARRDAVRSSLLIAASEGRRRGARSRWRLVGGGFAAGVLAAAAVALVVLRPAEPEPTHTRIGSSTDAKTLYSRHTSTPTGTDRVMRVTAGTFSLEVPPGRKTEHVRVQTGDGEVDGTGMYKVVVAADALASVSVSTGTATVRLKGQQQAVFLAAGQTWQPTVVTADHDVPPANVVPLPVVAPIKPVVVAEVVPAAPAAKPRSVSVAPTAPVEAPPEPRPAVTAITVEPSPGLAAGSSPTETAFRAGYALLRDNQFAAAALELGKAADGDGPLAADARYFQAVALTKAGRAADAERALVQFIDRAATSARRGRAVVMLARLLAARGEATSARAWYEDALRDSDASVVAAARAGIAALR